MVDCAALEMPCPGNWTVGSNPTLSAFKFQGGSYPPGFQGWHFDSLPELPALVP